MQKDKNKDRQELLREISNLKQQLLWYKRTYEERSLLGIIYERLIKKKPNTITKRNIRLWTGLKKRIKINKSISNVLLPRRILCVIVNHNHSDNAAKLYDELVNYFDSIIIDSGSDEPPRHSVRLPNIFYSGLLNEAYSIAKNNGYEYLLFICSDVIIKPAEAQKMHERLREIDFTKTGIYSPASKGGGHFFCKKQPTEGLRIVPFVEGFLFLCDLDILDQLCPIDTKENLYGWGLDIAKGFFARANKKVCLVDDNVEVEHLKGTGYSRETAELEMLSWIKTLHNTELALFFEEQLSYIRQHLEADTISEATEKEL